MPTVEVKRALVRAVTRPWVAPIFTPFLRGAGAVLMLHRIADPALGNEGHDPMILRRNLAALRRDRREVVALSELIRRVRENDLGATSPIAFTVDDGYADFATMGAPIFAEFDCPVTVFLVSGALDGPTWFWWDRITAAFRATRRTQLVLSIGGIDHSLAWCDQTERRRAAMHVLEALKLIPDAERRCLLSLLMARLEVALPDAPPPEFAPLSWSAARGCARSGVTFGAHTVTHPILSRLDDAVARCEIATSWRRLNEEALPATDIFCYPNGEPQDFTAREPVLLRELGFTSAVTTMPGYITAARYRGSEDAAFHLPRFSFPQTEDDFTQIASGFARAKLALREIGLA
jgi:peptidoglycan/xylan/chitin deacetylase (PgdA/CDA1 family)